MNKNDNPKVVVSFIIDRDIIRQFFTDCKNWNECINEALVNLVVRANRENEIFRYLFTCEDKNGKSN